MSLAIPRIRVLVVDGNPGVRAQLRGMLDGDPGMTVIADTATDLAALTLATAQCPEVTLLEYPARGGTAVVAALCGYTRVLLLTRPGGEEGYGVAASAMLREGAAERSNTVPAALRAGAHGYLVHGRFSPAQLGAAVRAAARGIAWPVRSAGRPPGPRQPERFGLTRREREVLELIVHGLTNKAIAEHLYLAPKTVRNHINRLFAKLGVTNREAAVRTWRG